MNMNYIRSAFHSIGLKITSLILITALPLIALLLYSNHQARHSLLAQIDSTHENMLQFYVNQMICIQKDANRSKTALNDGS